MLTASTSLSEFFRCLFANWAIISLLLSPSVLWSSPAPTRPLFRFRRRPPFFFFFFLPVFGTS